MSQKKKQIVFAYVSEFDHYQNMKTSNFGKWIKIKSAHPLNLDREKLVQENIKLKTQLNKLETEKMNHKREITNLENEIIKKDKIIETMINDTQSNINSDNNKASEMHLVLNVKRQYKELKKAYEKNQQELNSAKKNIKFHI